MVNPMLRPDVFGGLATHAGDALFEMCYLPEFRKSVRTLRDHYDGSFERFWEDFRSRPAFSKDTDHMLLNDYCMAACYSADEDGTVQLPYDPDTGELRPEIWERWLAWDPVRMARERADALRSLKAIYIDCGKRDQFYLDLGAEAFRRELEAIGRHGLLLRALRRDPLDDRVPLPARREVPGRTAVVIASPRRRYLPRPGHGTPPAIGRADRADRAGLARSSRSRTAAARTARPGRAGDRDARRGPAACARVPRGDDADRPDDPPRRRQRQHRAGEVLQPPARGADGAHPRRRLARPLAARGLDARARLAQGLDGRHLRAEPASRTGRRPEGRGRRPREP